MNNVPANQPYQAVEPGEISASEETKRVAASIARWQVFVSAILILATILGFAVMGFETLTDADSQSAVVGYVLVCVMLLIFYALPALLLFKASRRASEYSRTPSSSAFQRLAASQLLFWRTVAIITLVVVALYVGMIVIAIFGLAFSFI